MISSVSDIIAGINSLAVKLGEFFSVLSRQIGESFTTLWNNFFSWFSKFAGWWSDFWDFINDCWINFWDWIFNFFTNLENYFRKWLTPTLSFSDKLKQKFPILDQVQEMFSAVSQPGEKLEYTFDWQGHKVFAVNMDWYEPYREKIRLLLKGVFYGMFLIGVWRMVSATFNISTNSQGGVVMETNQAKSNRLSGRS